MHICDRAAPRPSTYSIKIKRREVVVATQILLSKKNRCVKQQRRDLGNGCEGNFGTARKLDLFYQIKRAIGSYEEKKTSHSLSKLIRDLK